MVDFRPHIMSWTAMSPSTTEPGTGYEIPGVPGEPKAVACRYYDLGSKGKELRNEDNKVVLQKGKIRLDVGSEMPDQFQQISVTDGGSVIFEGRAMNIYRGQKTWRIDV